MSHNAIHHEEQHLGDHLSMFRRRWRTLLATFVSFMAVAALVNYRLPSGYQATTKIVIGSISARGFLSEGITPLEGYFLERRSFETQLEIVRSEPVALLAAAALGWLGDDASSSEREAMSSAVKRITSAVGSTTTSFHRRAIMTTSSACRKSGCSAQFHCVTRSSRTRSSGLAPVRYPTWLTRSR